MNWRELRHNRRAMIGASILGVFIVVAVLAPVIVPYAPTADPLHAQPSSRRALTGWAPLSMARTSSPRFIWGARASLFVGVLCAVADQPHSAGDGRLRRLRRWSLRHRRERRDQRLSRPAVTAAADHLGRVPSGRQRLRADRRDRRDGLGVGSQGASGSGHHAARTALRPSRTNLGRESMAHRDDPHRAEHARDHRLELLRRGPLRGVGRGRSRVHRTRQHQRRHLGHHALLGAGRQRHIARRVGVAPGARTMPGASGHVARDYSISPLTKSRTLD